MAVMSGGTGASHAGTVVADWTFNQATPDDSVGGHDFLTVTGTPPNTYGTSSIGGASTNPAFFNGGGGYYDISGGTTTLPTNNFSLSLDTEVPAADLTQTGFLFSTDGNGDGNIQIAQTEGDFVAYYNDASHLDAFRIGSFPATSGDTQLTVTDLGGVLSFQDNGVSGSGTLLNGGEVASFGTPYVGIAPNSGVDFPEPSAFAMSALGLLILTIARRLRPQKTGISGRS